VLGRVTTLLGVIEELGSVDGELTIYAATPWTESSKAVVPREPASVNLPAEAQTLGLKYFLEVAIARDFLEDWAASLGHEPSKQERCERLIQYAVSDA
jgi:hypothetical protein